MQAAIATFDLPAYVRWSFDHREDFDDLDSWQSPLWNFARLLKAHPEFQDVSSAEVLRVIDPIVASWAQEDPWASSFDIASAEDAHVELLSIWHRIRYIPGLEPLEQAVKRARQEPLGIASKRTPGYERFISVAGWLQVIMGDSDILLPCEKLSTYLDCEPMTVSRYRKWAVDDKFLTLVKPHRFRSSGGEATTFHFDVGRFPILIEAAKRTT